MDTGSVIMLIGSNLLVGLVLWAATAAGANGGLSPNPLGGIRTRATMASPQAWAAGHRAALGWVRLLLFGMSACVAAAIVLLAMHRSGAAYAAAFAGLGVMILGTIPLVLVANRAARAAQAPDDHPVP